MASIAHLRGEERLGLGVAVVAHAALFALLLWHANRPAPIIPPAERMTVSLADEVSLESTAPDPADEAAAAVAPILAPQPEPVPAPVTEPVPKPVEIAIEKPVPQPKATVAPPKPKTSSAPAKPATKAPPKPAPKPTGGGSRLGDDFLAGVGNSQTTAKGTPARAFGAAEAASLAQAISRQLKPHWAAPQGPDVEKLVTVVRFRLNPDGSLSGNPTVVSQTGITPTNEPQKSRHAEQAIRAVRLAAPFDLPEEFYEKWKTITTTFDRRL